MVEQERYPIGRRSLEFPQGSDPEVSGEALARRELEEETGLGAGRLTHLGRLDQAPGFATLGFDAWLAEELTGGEPRRSIEEQDMETRKIRADSFEDLVRSGAITDAATVGAWALLQMAPTRH